MAETIGKIISIKVNSFLRDGECFRHCNISLKETSTGTTWLFHLWQSRDDALAVHRVVESQRLALAREAAVRKLTVHVFAEADSGLLTESKWIRRDHDYRSWSKPEHVSAAARE